MIVDRSDVGEVTVLAVSGHLDALNAPMLKEQSEALIAEGRVRFVFDMSAVELIDSSGVGAVVSLFKKARTRGGDVKIACLDGQPKEIFKLLRLDAAFDIADDVDTATRGFEA